MGDHNASVNFGFNSTLNSSWLKTYDKLGILGPKKGKKNDARSVVLKAEETYENAGSCDEQTDRLKAR